MPEPRLNSMPAIELILPPAVPMTHRAMNVANLGSTGSIGRSTLDVLAASDGSLPAVALAASTSAELLLQQAGRFGAKWLVLCDEQARSRHNWCDLPQGTRLL